MRRNFGVLQWPYAEPQTFEVLGEGFKNVGHSFDYDNRALELSIYAEIESRVKPLCDPSMVVWGRNVEKMSKSALATQLALGMSERLHLGFTLRLGSRTL